MKKNNTGLLVGACLLAGLLCSSALAENLGLAEMSSSSAVAQAVKEKVSSIYSSTDDQEQIKAQIVAIMNEAAETGDEEIVRSAIIAAMNATVADNVSLTIAAINSSNAASRFSQITTDAIQEGGGQKQGGGQQQGGGKEQGGGDDRNPLEDGEDANIIDNDLSATPV